MQLSRLKATNKDKALLNDEITVHTRPQQILGCAPSMEINDFKVFEESKGPFVSFVPEVCMMGGIADSNNTEITTLAEIFSAQSITWNVVLRSRLSESRIIVLTSKAT